MAAKEPTSNLFAGPGFGLQSINGHAYAYSGAIPLNNETKTALEFKTGNFMFFSNTQLTGPTASLGANENLGLIISLNGVRVLLQQPMANSSTGGIGLDYDSFALIIPPYTEVKVEVITNNTDNLDFYATMTGRVYGAE